MENQNDQANVTPGAGNPPMQQSPSNQSFQTLLKSKYMMAILAAIVLLMAIIFSIVFMNANSTSNSTTAPSPTSSGQTTSPSNSVSNPVTSRTPSIGNIVVTTPEPTQAALIENQTQPQISPNIAVPYTVAKINQYGSDWAIMEITNPDTDPANVVVKKENGIWKVILGPGTHFDIQDLQKVGAPQELINDANSNL